MTVVKLPTYEFIGIAQQHKVVDFSYRLLKWQQCNTSCC